MSTYVDQSGYQVSLGSLIGKGGEGSVYRITASPDNVAKIYHGPLSHDREEKLWAITSVATPEVRAVCAWPSCQLLMGKSLQGFMMPFMPNRHELHVLHGPKSRKAKFPDASYGFLVHVAWNISRAFAVLHAENIMVGDVNDRGIMIGHDGTVRIIDCDSFQFATSTKQFLCDVGTPGFTPPELQGRHLRSLRRTPDHDNFGLAVIIFLLLFMGRHPFAGRYEKGQIEPEVAIKEYRYAYSCQANRTLMAPPPNTIAIDRAVNQSVAHLFERAFGPPAGSQSQRPTALDWAKALASLRSDLTVCQFNRAHEYVTALKICPWCELEQRSGIDLFNFIDAGANGGPEIDLEPIWQAISSIVIPTVPVPISERSLGRLQGSPLPPVLAEKASLLQERKDESTRASGVAGALAAEAIRKQTEAEELKIQITDQDPGVAKLTKTIARLERPPLFVGTWCVAVIYFVAVYVFAPQFPILGFGFLIVVLPSFFFFTEIRKRRLVATRKKLKTARDAAFAADPFGLQHVFEIENSARDTERNSSAAAAVARAIDLDAEKLANEIAVAKAELHDRLLIELAALETQFASAKATLDHCRSRARDLQREYDSRTQFLRAGLTQWRQLKARRDGEIKKLRDHDRDNRFHAFLDSHFIARADIPGITPALKATLASFGIETAADIDAKSIRNVQGFGPKRTSKMIAWRRRVAAQFTYVPNQTIDPQKIRAIHARFATDRRRFERDFQVALTDLREKSGALASAVLPVSSCANEIVRKTAQVRADIQMLSSS